MIQEGNSDTSVFEQALQAVGEFRRHYGISGMDGVEQDHVHDRIQAPLHALSLVIELPARRKAAGGSVGDRELLAVLKAIKLHSDFVKLTGRDWELGKTPKKVVDFYNYDFEVSAMEFLAVVSAL